MRLIRELRQDSKLFVLVVVGIFTAILLGILIGDKLYTPRSLMSMAYQIPEFALIAVGMALAFLTGGIDLSLVANANTSGIFAAMVLKGRWFPGLSEGAAILVAILVALVSSMLFGLLNGVIIGKLSAQPMIVTLASMLFISGIGMALTSGNAIVGFPDAFTNIGTAHLFGVPVIFIFSMIVILLFAKPSVPPVQGAGCISMGKQTAARFPGLRWSAWPCWCTPRPGCLRAFPVSRSSAGKLGRWAGEAYLLKALLVCMIGGINPDGGKGRSRGADYHPHYPTAHRLFDHLGALPYSKKLIWEPCCW